MSLFGKSKKRKVVTEGLWTKCDDCSHIIYNKTLIENNKVCPNCDYHFTLTAFERRDLLVDNDTFEEIDRNLRSIDPLDFKGPKTYKEKLKDDQKNTGLIDAVITGSGNIDNQKVIIGFTDSRFFMGSMGSVLGEKITRAVEEATRLRLPLIIVSGSGGGARMHEGVFSLMQMAKTSAAISKHNKEGLLYISVLTNPTMAGVMASFASLGDIIIAEPRALIGFTGPRVIEQTIKQKLPKDFQRSEFLLKHGLIDKIVHRKDLKSSLSRIIKYLS